jgi:NhaA family Na+:H+ antiporter
MITRITRFVLHNSLLLLGGTVVAVAWANLDLPSYEPVAHSLHFWVNDVGMVFFFALAAKEVFEATLPGGPLASPRLAFSAGGGDRRHGGAGGHLRCPGGKLWAGRVDERMGDPMCDRHRVLCLDRPAHLSPAHPAIPFLLLLAIADDALGLIILALFYPSGSLSAAALSILMTAAVLLGVVLRRRRTLNF